MFQTYVCLAIINFSIKEFMERIEIVQYVNSTITDVIFAREKRKEELENKIQITEKEINNIDIESYSSNWLKTSELTAKKDSGGHWIFLYLCNASVEKC